MFGLALPVVVKSAVVLVALVEAPGVDEDQIGNRFGRECGVNAALVFAGEEPDSFTPYRLSGNGANKEHFHTLGLSDAFAGTGVDGLSTTDTGTIDYETLLEIDPDSLLLRYHREGKTREEFENDVLAYMQDHPVGSQLTAVQDGRVFRGGPIYSGPLHNLFMIERFATGYFPETFSEDQLFDRDRLATIITEGVGDA